MPGGEVGARAYARMRALAQPMRFTLKLCERLGVDAEPIVVPIDLDIGGVRLVGAVDNVFRRSDGALHVFHAKPAWRDGFSRSRSVLCRLGSAAIVASQRFASRRRSNIRTRQKRRATPENSPMRFFRRTRLATPQWTRRTAAHDAHHATNAPPLFLPRDRVGVEHRCRWAPQCGSAQGMGRRFSPRRRSPLRAELRRARRARDSEFLNHTSLAHEKFVATNRWISRILDPNQTVLVRTGTRDDACDP